MPNNIEKILKNMVASRDPGAGEILGVIPTTETQPGPQGPTTSWGGPNGAVEMDEAPPPWELEDQNYTASDARRFIECPPNVTLRWMNPKFIEAAGWRYWRQVSLGDTRFKLKVDQMEMPDGTIRRGGPTGDILSWMLTSWVEKLRLVHQRETDLQTQKARDRFEQTKDDLRRGKYGPYVGLEESSSKPQHPTHTMADGRTMKD